MQCEACGTEIPAEAVFCSGCGRKLTDAGTIAGSSAAPPTGAQKLQEHAAQLRHAPDVAEQELWRGRYSVKAMYGPMIICGVITLMAIIVILIVSYAWLKIAIAAAIGIMWLWIGGQVLHKQVGIRYRLTNQRFFVERGVLRRVTDRVEVIDINDLKFEQTLFERIFDVGSITVTSSDHSLPVVTLEGIEHVEQVANVIDQARRAERNRRSLYIETS